MDEITKQLAEQYNTTPELIGNIRIEEADHLVYFTWNNNGVLLCAKLSRDNKKVKKNSISRI